MRKTICLVAAAMLLAAAGAASAQSFPTQTVRLVTVLSPGTDTYIRVLADRLAVIWGKPVLVENRPGAAGVAAVQAVTTAQPDGHTLLVYGPAFFISKAVQPDLAMDPITQLAPVVKVWGNGPLGLLVGGGSPAKSVDDIVARLKPGTMKYGSAGFGLIHHLAVEMFLKASQTQALHVPFKGPDLYLALMRGDVDFTVSPLGPIMEQVRAGQFRLLATMGAERHSALPNVPTLREVLKNDLLVMEFWAGLAAPAQTPAPIIAAIHEATVKSLEDAKVRAAIEIGLNVPAAAESTAAFAALARRENDKLRETVKVTGIKSQK